jgi:hypothetical protein
MLSSNPLLRTERPNRPTLLALPEKPSCASLPNATSTMPSAPKAAARATIRSLPRLLNTAKEKSTIPSNTPMTWSDAADQTRETERGTSASPAIEQRIQSAHEQYRRDLQCAVFQLESQPRDQVRLEIAERRPERAYDSPSFRLHGQPDPSYAVAVVQQAEKARELTDKGRSLEQVLDAAQHRFGGHLREALNAREATKPRSEVIDRISQSVPVQEFYARAVVNQAESIREQKREMSIRPEMARAVIEQSRPAPEQEIARTTATVER